MNRAVLESAGIDVQEGLDRMMGNEALYERLLGRFLDDVSCDRIAEAIVAEDAEAAAGAVHALKGVAGNLSIKSVYETASLQCALFRSGEWEQAVALSSGLEERVACAKVAIERAFREA